jgi:hypothetical protein
MAVSSQSWKGKSSRARLAKSKNRLKSAWLGANPASFRTMYSRMKARNCPCRRVGPPGGGAVDDPPKSLRLA